MIQLRSVALARMCGHMVSYSYVLLFLDIWLTEHAAVRVEQNVAGGKGVPACKSSSGDDATLEAQDASTLCACLYKNFTPQPK
jgi:hypothetical protein